MTRKIRIWSIRYIILPKRPVRAIWSILLLPMYTPLTAIESSWSFIITDYANSLLVTVRLLSVITCRLPEL